MAGDFIKAPLAAAFTTALLLAACDNGPSAVAGKSASASSGAQASDAEGGASTSRSYARRDDRNDGVDHRQDPVKLVDGKPVWAASRRYSADESAQHAFSRNGEAFGASNLQDYVRKAHAFVEHPPKGVETLTRANGDTLFYDARENVFAVADKGGAPRTMFKPDDGASYWQEQKDREAKRDQTAQSNRKPRKGADDDA